MCSLTSFSLGLNTLRQHNSGHNAIVGTSSIIPACCGRAKASPQTNPDVGGQRHSLKADKAVETTWCKIWAPSWHSFVEWIVCEQMAEQKLWVSRPVIVSHVNFMWIGFCEAHVSFFTCTSECNLQCKRERKRRDKISVRYKWFQVYNPQNSTLFSSSLK